MGCFDARRCAGVAAAWCAAWLMCGCGADVAGAPEDGGADGTSAADGMHGADAQSDGSVALDGGRLSPDAATDVSSDTQPPGGDVGPEGAVDAAADVLSGGTDATLVDAGVHRVVLSEGENAGGLLTDTWLWDGTGWTQQSVSGPTPARNYAAAATLDGQIVLYGGLGMPLLPAFGFLADTWVYDGKVWTQQNVASGPENRFAAAAAALAGRVVLFGGDVTSGGVNPPPPTTPADTWTWDGTRWTFQNVPGPPPRLYGTAAAWNGKVVLFGGNDGGILGSLSDTWIWDGAAWTQQNVSGPAARFSACAATLNGELVLFGGTDNAGADFGDTWVWDGVTWTQKSGSGPSPRHACSAATLDGKIVLFGGVDTALDYFGDTWIWDGVSWTQAIVTGPPARFGQVMGTL